MLPINSYFLCDRRGLHNMVHIYVADFTYYLYKVHPTFRYIPPTRVYLATQTTTQTTTRTTTQTTTQSLEFEASWPY